jgi:disulfide bond formation protein DsbB
MDPRDVSNFFALAAALALFGGIGAATRKVTRQEISRHAPTLVGLAAIGATVGSLYFSEVANYLPCTLCWYQRIAMYPLAVMMPIAAALRDRNALRYSLALAGTGLVISIYHIQLELFPDQTSVACELTNPCTIKWVEALGFVTIPQMAGATFTFIVLVSLIGLRHDGAVSPAPSDHSPDEQTQVVPR